MREKVARQLCGRDVDIVKEGLNPSQVEELVTELVTERDLLLERQEHLASLTRLAERSIAEADRLAQEIKQEAEDDAQNKASAILAKAEQEARELAERKKGEILSAANKEAEAIKDNARQEAARLISQRQQQTQRELEEIAQNLHRQLLTGLKDVNEHAATLQMEWQNRITEAFSGTQPPTASEPSSSTVVEPGPTETLPEETVEPTEDVQPDVAASPPETAKPDQNPEGEMSAPPAGKADLNYRQDILAQIEQAWLESENKARTSSQTLIEATKASELAQGTEEREVSTIAEEAAPSKNYEGTLYLDIQPPLTPTQLVEIQKYLRAWSGIGITELSPHDKGYSITVVLNKPMQLIDMLKQVPEVTDAREYTPDNQEAGDTGTSTRDGEKRICVTVRPKN